MTSFEEDSVWLIKYRRIFTPLILDSPSVFQTLSDLSSTAYIFNDNNVCILCVLIFMQHKIQLVSWKFFCILSGSVLLIFVYSSNTQKEQSSFVVLSTTMIQTYFLLKYC